MTVASPSPWMVTVRENVALGVELADEDAVIEGALLQLQRVAGLAAATAAEIVPNPGLHHPGVMAGRHGKCRPQGDGSAEQQTCNPKPCAVTHVLPLPVGVPA